MMKKSTLGFSLVELLIGAALLGGLALGFNSIMANMNKGNLKAQTDSEILLAFNEMVSILADPDDCIASLGGKNAVNDTTVTKLKYKTTDKFIVGTPFGNNDLKLSSYKISGYDAMASSAILTVFFEKKKLLGGGNISKKINLNVNLNGAGIITSCRSLATSSSELWERSSTIPSNIFYNAGKVGIGTNAPNTSLDVNGGIRPGDSSIVTTCNVSQEGVQRYNRTLHVMEYCGGSPLAWLSMRPMECTIVETISGFSPKYASGGGYIFVAKGTPTCPAGYKALACSAKRMTDIGYSFPSGAVNYITLTYPFDQYIDQVNNRCDISTAIYVVGTGAASFNPTATLTSQVSCCR